MRDLPVSSAYDSMRKMTGRTVTESVSDHDRRLFAHSVCTISGPILSWHGTVVPHDLLTVGAEEVDRFLASQNHQLKRSNLHVAAHVGIALRDVLSW